MSAKKKSNWLEAVRDATTGYAAVVLGVICFLLALAVIVAGVRVVVGSPPSSTSVAPVSVGATAHVSGNGAA